MSRVIQVRVHGLDEPGRAAMQARFGELVAARDWRGGRPWLADRASPGLLAQLFFDSAHAESRRAGTADLCGAGFVRVAGDEADALALLFIARDISERTGAAVELNDPDNPIAKLRHLGMREGRLADGAALETILVQRAIYRRMPDGTRMEMLPPRARGSAFGTAIDDGAELSWSFIVHDIRVVDPSFLRAEAEAMRIFRGLRALPTDER